jgi:glycosyltransferase involved in cell wall biosynthesis
MDYFPNIDAVSYFARSVFPMIRAKMPDAEFRVIGSAPPPRIRHLERIPGIQVTGHVPDVRTYVMDAAVSVAPLRIARGTQNKILESMAMGIPVVATSEAAKGIQATPGRDLLVGDDADAFAKHVLSLLQNVRLREELSRAGIRQVKNAHLWTNCMDLLDGVLAKAHSNVSDVGVGSF